MCATSQARVAAALENLCDPVGTPFDDPANDGAISLSDKGDAFLAPLSDKSRLMSPSTKRTTGFCRASRGLARSLAAQTRTAINMLG